jgi:hypothetical protein
VRGSRDSALLRSGGRAALALSGDLGVRMKDDCGIAAGPVFVSVFTALGAKKAGYDWRCCAVSSLADGREGWPQRANFVLVGGLYCIAAANGLTKMVSTQIVTFKAVKKDANIGPARGRR